MILQAETGYDEWLSLAQKMQVGCSPQAWLRQLGTLI